MLFQRLAGILITQLHLEDDAFHEDAGMIPEWAAGAFSYKRIHIC